jgi:hypothetical protein
MRNLGLTKFRRPKCVIGAGEITFRAVTYEEKKWTIYTYTDHGGHNKYIWNLYRNLLCGDKEIEVIMIICILGPTMEIMLLTFSIPS